ncbi:hypothetical protein Vadar_001582 [Vaccinium darrowii]|uniref:Uncharacterized protein n=1 Tax=Vaccinium darrowii TaxID=229202 RepID=A0ACB7YS46_9ERIC|nr:hypothetical protein Vadar_001582 [Vaccinium darrowii]
MAVTEKCDVYSFGVLTHEILMLSHPGELISNLYPSTDNQNIQLAEVLDPRLSLPTSQKLKDELDSIMNLAIWCLRADPNSRPTMYEVSQVLEMKVAAAKESPENQLQASENQGIEKFETPPAIAKLQISNLRTLTLTEVL